MDPCLFVRLTVGNLALKIPVASKATRTAVHPSSSPCFCKIKLKNFQAQSAVIPLLTSDSQFPEGNSTPNAAAATFYLSKSDVDKLIGKSLFAGKLSLEITIFTGRLGSLCGMNSGSPLGKISIPLDFSNVDSRAVVFQSGWVNVGKESKGSCAQLRVNVKAEPDPRFVFQFDNEPECNPQVFQIQGNKRQPVFSCKLGFRNPHDRTRRTNSFSSEQSVSRNWLTTFQPDKDRAGKERKGWSVTVHDLSGSPVAVASMVTPFVASPGTDRVSRSNPGSWLILRPGDNTWKPWGRLEAWRERGSSDGLGYRFELISDTAAAGLVLAESTINCSKGGKFVIDLSSTCSNVASPVVSPASSGDFGYSLWRYCLQGGFVMSASIEGEGKGSKPTVEVGVQHVGCAEDAAAFVALAAAVDLSMDACRLFSQKLRKELCQPSE